MIHAFLSFIERITKRNKMQEKCLLADNQIKIILNISDFTDNWNKIALQITKKQTYNNMTNEKALYEDRDKIKNQNNQVLILNLSDFTNDWNNIALDVARKNRLI